MNEKEYAQSWSGADTGDESFWNLSMQFDIRSLRTADPIARIIEALFTRHHLKSQRQIITTIISELLTNAIDHGLLRLDSTQKRTPKDFLEFYRQRQERLSSTTEGLIEVKIEHTPIVNGSRLVINVTDSGQGFTPDKVFSDVDNNQQFFGRGIQLVKKLCRSVEYLGNGNHVKAVYEWHH
ncbi:MAG: hypothetical protein Kow0065_01110 [Methylomicrobium sp.]